MIEGPHKLPEGWRWVRLGEVCEINPRRPRLPVDPNEPTTFVPMTAVEDQTGTIVTPEVRPFEQVRQGYTYFEEGDVLFAKITPCMENGKTAIARGLLNGFGFGSTEFHVLRPSGSVVAEWIWLFIRQERFRKAAKASFRGGVGQQRVPKEFLEHHPIPLPPLDEQRRIVARLEELISRVREAKRLRQQAKEDAERLMQAALAEVFPRPGTEPPTGWRWVKLGEVCEVWDALRKPVKKKDRIPGDVPYCGANGVIDYVDGYTHAGEFVLLAEDGGFYGPGEPTAYIMSGRFWANNHVHILRGRPDHLVNQLLYYCLVAYDLRPFLTGATRPKLTQGAMRSIPIPLPPFDEQRRIVAHLEAVQEKVRALKEAQAATDAELQRLEQAILDKAFRGEL